MTRQEKRLEAFKECEGTFSWSELEGLLIGLGYERIKAGKTGGSRRKYIHTETKQVIMLHEPHGDEMGKAMVKRLKEDLSSQGII